MKTENTKKKVDSVHKPSERKTRAIVSSSSNQKSRKLSTSVTRGRSSSSSPGGNPGESKLSGKSTNDRGSTRSVHHLSTSCSGSSSRGRRSGSASQKLTSVVVVKKETLRKWFRTGPSSSTQISWTRRSFCLQQKYGAQFHLCCKL